jgi:phosphatidylinositol alpha-1,6-mannosyltransferase
MKLLVISSEFPPGPGGIGHHAYSLAKALHQEDHDVTVLTVSDFAAPEVVSAFDARHEFPIIRFPRIGWRTYFRRISIIHGNVKEGGYDCVLLTGKFSLWAGYYLRKRFPGQRTLAILHGSEINPPNRFLRWLTHSSIAAANGIVSVSAFTASLLPGRIRTKRKISIIPNGIDVDQLSAYGDAGSIQMKGTPKLLTVGHVSPRKGQHRVIRALPLLRKRYPDIHFHMVGRPLQRERLTELARSLGVEGHITFHGVAESHRMLAGYYRNADAFMLLSENQPNGDVEGFGIVALEANFFCLPVIGARFCGVEDAVSDGESGFLVDAEKPEEIDMALQRCIQMNEALEKGSREWAMKHDWNRIVHEFIRELE